MTKIPNTLPKSEAYRQIVIVAAELSGTAQAMVALPEAFPREIIAAMLADFSLRINNFSQVLVRTAQEEESKTTTLNNAV